MNTTIFVHQKLLSSWSASLSSSSLLFRPCSTIRTTPAALWTVPPRQRFLSSSLPFTVSRTRNETNTASTYSQPAALFSVPLVMQPNILETWNKPTTTTTTTTNDNEHSTSSNNMTDPHTDIEELHQIALRQGSTTYVDPQTGFTVFTELSHLKRGKCCGNRCRHCPYGWSNVRSSSSVSSRPPIVQSGNLVAVQQRLERLLQMTTTKHRPSNSDAFAISSGVHQSRPNDEYPEQLATNIESSKRRNNSTTTSSFTTPPIGKGGRHGGTHTNKNVPYTRGGDKGTAQLLTGERRSKDDLAFEAMGTVDELCSFVGVVHAELQCAGEDSTTRDLQEWLLEIMSRLFDLGSHVAKPRKTKKKTDQHDDDDDNGFTADGVGGGFHQNHIDQLEEWIDDLTEQLPELTSFILPTGSKASAQLHVARTVCRRAERRVVGLVEIQVCDPTALRYLNRLSDFFFVAARWANYCQGRDEIQYRRETRSTKQRNRHTVSLTMDDDE